MSFNPPMRPCANSPKCQNIIRADVGSLHCQHCHDTDPQLIAAAAQYRERVRLRKERENVA